MPVASTSAASTATPSPNPLISAMPLLFVLIWSTGFVIARFGLPYAPPLTFLLLRFVSVLLLLGPLVWLMKAPWPVGKTKHIAIAGVLVQAGYLAGVWCSIKLGMPAGLSALIVGMQPVLTAFAAPLVGETVRARQWVGLILGLGGVGLVVASKLTLAGVSWASVALCVFALLCITGGTLYQKHHCAHFDLRTGTIIQFAASALVILPFTIAFENFSPLLETVQWTPQFIGAWLWSVFALSIGAIFLLFALIRRSAATQVTSLLYLTPPTTALMAWLVFGEAFSIMGMIGMMLAVIGVAFVVRK
ncbi:MAG TPA: DMT family transporter [Burkholderiaceae bacterium]|nr:DMT family transporter [Burkholderiaceae bacterium]